MPLSAIRLFWWAVIITFIGILYSGVERVEAGSSGYGHYNLYFSSDPGLGALKASAAHAKLSSVLAGPSLVSPRQSVQGNTYYVRPDGNGNGSGPAATEAWNNIQDAANPGALSPGDTVYIAPGTYGEAVNFYNSGMASQRITIIGNINGDRFPDIGPGEVVLEYLEVYGAAFHIWSAHYITIENLIITTPDGAHGFVPVSAQGIIFRNNVIHNFHNGVTLEDFGNGPPSVIFENNRIYDNQKVGINLAEYNTGEIIIRNNLIYNNGGPQVDVGPKNQKAMVYNNVLIDRNDAFFGDNCFRDSGGPNTEFKNNICIGDAGDVINVHPGVDRSHNLYYSYANATIPILGPGSLNADPQFVDIASGDFRLKASSPAIEAGIALPGIGQDIDGISRPQGAGYDIGAYEFSGTTNTTSVEHLENAPPKNYTLRQNYPNPFNPVTVIAFNLPRPQRVVLKVYNLNGQQVLTITNEEYSAGFHTISWHGLDSDGDPVSSGVYLYRLQAGEFARVRKMMLLR